MSDRKFSVDQVKKMREELERLAGDQASIGRFMGKWGVPHSTPLEKFVRGCEVAAGIGRKAPQDEPAAKPQPSEDSVVEVKPEGKSDGKPDAKSEGKGKGKDAR